MSTRWTRTNLQVVWNSVVTEAYGNEKGRLGGVKVENVKTKDVRDIPVNIPTVP